MQITLVFSNPAKKPLIRQQGKGRAGWSDIRQDDVSANVNQNALVCWQLKSSEGSSSRVKIPDPALKPLKSEMMPLSVEACSLWLGIKKGFLAAADKGFKRVTGIIHKSAKPLHFLLQALLDNILAEEERRCSIVLLGSVCSRTTLWHTPMTGS